MATTQDEKTQAEKLNEEVVVSKKVTVADVLAAYNQGANYYDLALRFFDSDSEQALERVRAIVEAETDTEKETTDESAGAE